MEPKKNPKVDIHGKRGLIFNFSLLLSLFIVICAFQVVVRTKKIVLPEPEIKDPDLLYIPPVTNFKTEKSKEPPKPKQISVSPTEFREVTNIAISIQPTPAIDIEKAPEQNTTTITVEPPPIEKTDSIFRIVEKMPVPVGGYEAFFNTLRSNIKYPSQARRTGTEGKVFVEFTVNERGELENMHAITGIGAGCNEEAIRVLKLTKWEAGKQRGKPVKVRLVQQVNFKLAR